jgi:glutamate racemase
VPLVEEGWFDQPETKMIVRKYIQPLKNKQVDTLILGCTHYPAIKNIIGPRIGRKVKMVDSAEEIVNELKIFLASHPDVEKKLAKGENHKFYVSDLTPRVPVIAKKLLGREVKLEKAAIE